MFNNKNKIFKKFLFSYIFILFIPLTIGAIAYKEALNIVVKDTKKISMSTLDQNRSTLDQRFAEVDNLVTFLSTNSKTTDILRIKDPFEVVSAQKIFDLKEFLSIYSVTNTFIDNIYIHFTENDIILSPYTANLQGRKFYGKFFKYGDMDVDQWYEKVLNTHHFKKYLPVNKITIGNHQRPMLPYIQSIPVGSPSDIHGAVMIFIDIEKFEEYLKPLVIDNGGWAYITDQDGNIITMVSEDGTKPVVFDLENQEGYIEQTRDGRRMIVVYTTSSYNGWTYVSALPYHVAMYKVEYIKRIIFTIVGISLTFSLVAAFFLAYRNSKPIKDLILTIRNRLGQDQYKDSNDYEFLDHSITTIIDNNAILKEKVEKQLPYLRVMFFDRLLNGGLINFDGIEMLCQHVGIDVESIRHKRSISCILWINTYQGQINNRILQELDVVKTTLKDLTIKYTKGEVYVLDIDFDKVVLILPISKSKEKTYREYVTKLESNISKVLLERYDTQILFACGSIKESLLETGSSYEEAKRVLEYTSFKSDKTIVWYDHFPINYEVYYYSLEVELRLISSVKSGELEAVEKILKDVYNQNFVDRSLSSEMIRNLIYDIKGTIIKLLDQIRFNKDLDKNNIKQRIDDLDSCISLVEMYNNAKAIFFSICNIIIQDRQNNNNLLKEKLTTYLHRNYSNSQLSLTALAEEFDLTEAYLSHFFKIHMDLCFSEFLENIRMEKACELLSSTELNINDIAQRLGYNSSHSFRRAFKRVRGVNPLLYRKELS